MTRKELHSEGFKLTKSKEFTEKHNHVYLKQLESNSYRKQTFILRQSKYDKKCISIAHGINFGSNTTIFIGNIKSIEVFKVVMECLIS